MPDVEWILLLPQLPAASSSLRVSVWRRMKAAGSISVQGGAWLLPATPRTEQLARETLEHVKAAGGTGLLFISRLAGGQSEGVLEESFREGVDQEYAEFAERCQGLLDEIGRESRQGKFTFAELDENEEELQKLTSWLRKIRARDFFGGARAGEADTAVEACRQSLAEFEKQVYLHEGLEPQGTGAGERDA